MPTGPAYGRPDDRLRIASATKSSASKRCRRRGKYRAGIDLDHGFCRQTNAASLGSSVCIGVAVPLTWFVTFEIRKRGLLRKRERSPRETHTFATEAEAKLFAQTKLEEGLVVFAGTINPHSPKRIILSRNIAGWLAEENEPLSRSKDQPV
jgi:hypothetical protein